ncbi:MAG: L-idonate 5-dehydrogenase [Arenicellales bacterium]|jgi:L-idonate 5-dehydrogenase|nr:L-idonate 5-dehydrogenase [Acidiferrobacteraceae bacterium]MCP4925051.1 L-idonate 5-dehydrogenase [Gammaproteobacteria bacterium]MDP6268496.1 L-idonate 5-dehydrogenase [Arenicellales bacterium]MDP7618021.1 L-idonate 5-dehydrogenase [Arenicellales bacterium]|tara:strand:- start:8230 stop:9261 length:1032 start_codon:yes stop_codon:yes gene_type:complete
MKSIVCHGPKDIRIEERPSPVADTKQVLIRVNSGGICGSDLHYYNNGGFGEIRLREPMILGHEISGHITALGEGVAGLSVGDLVAVNPSRPCNDCEFCREAMYNQCLNMRYYGSAMRFPHIQGAFSEQLVVDDSQCVRVAEGVTPQQAAFAEPLAVALAAVNKLGNLKGKHLLVTGTGPIGALVVAVAKVHNPLEVVATDRIDTALEYARAAGADKTINVASEASALDEYRTGKGRFDAVVEASGSEQALRTALNVLRPRGTLVLLGLGGEVTLPLNELVAKEIQVRGNFRFHQEFFSAVELIGEQRLPLEPLLTGVFPLDDAAAAFETANDRQQSMKVQLQF